MYEIVRTENKTEGYSIFYKRGGIISLLVIQHRRGEGGRCWIRS